VLAHEPCVLQHPEVLRDRGPADRQSCGELADGHRPLAEPLEHGAARLLAECFDCLTVSIHLP